MHVSCQVLTVTPWHERIAVDTSFDPCGLKVSGLAEYGNRTENEENMLAGPAHGARFTPVNLHRFRRCRD